MKKIIKAIGLCLGVIALAAAAFILYLFVTDYRPQDDEEVVLEGSGSRRSRLGMRFPCLLLISVTVDWMPIRTSLWTAAALCLLHRRRRSKAIFPAWEIF